MAGAAEVGLTTASWSRRASAKWWYAVAATFNPSISQKINKTEMLEATRRNCPSQFMQDKKFIDLLLIGGGNLTNFCECLAVRFATQLDDADYGNESSVMTKWAASQKFCLAVTLSK